MPSRGLRKPTQDRSTSSRSAGSSLRTRPGHWSACRSTRVDHGRVAVLEGPQGHQPLVRGGDGKRRLSRAAPPLRAQPRARLKRPGQRLSTTQAHRTMPVLQEVILRAPRERRPRSAPSERRPSLPSTRIAHPRIQTSSAIRRRRAVIEGLIIAALAVTGERSVVGAVKPASRGGRSRRPTVVRSAGTCRRMGRASACRLPRDGLVRQPLPDAAALLIGSVGTQLSPPRRARLLVSADRRGRVDVVGNVAVDGNVDRTSIATKPGQASVSGRYLLGLQ
jgi:hypothetical protein